MIGGAFSSGLRPTSGIPGSGSQISQNNLTAQINSVFDRRQIQSSQVGTRKRAALMGQLKLANHDQSNVLLNRARVSVTPTNHTSLVPRSPPELLKSSANSPTKAHYQNEQNIDIRTV